MVKFIAAALIAMAASAASAGQSYTCVPAPAECKVTYTGSATPAVAAEYFQDAHAAIREARGVSKLIGVVKYDMDRGIVVLHRDGISRINSISRATVYKVMKLFDDRNLHIREVRVTDRHARQVHMRMFNHNRKTRGLVRFEALKDVAFPKPDNYVPAAAK
ncbi:hypothetical protein [Paracoccus sp. MKU1]|uniref:hypothetical protein n=1 Tax=Paracoccus sp. MKU1 TaxID=1745182 RepID=UPI0007191469|nr:hypothetical protein [Paracoccus sp. MKU1]KRW94316.1 hypothetical protein AQY21_20520 [Paracoccus sp. MKU1]